MSRTIFNAASDRELLEILRLLAVSGLPEEGAALNLRNFIVAKAGPRLIGCAGLENSGKIGLLRSVAVDAEFRGRKIARELCTAVEALAQQQGLEELYLLTTTAPDFFRKIGYTEIGRSEAPEAILNNKQFTTLCPSTAVLMRKRL